MKDIAYYPGCTLTVTARNLDMSARAAMEKLDVNLAELPRWNCCGTVSGLASDNLMDHVGPIRLLVRAQEMGSAKLATLCTMCFHTLRMSNRLVQNEPDRLEKINSFMDREEDYAGDVKVLHLLEVLRDDIGFEAVKSRVEKELKGLKLVSYYGCLLTRPKEVAIDDVEAPTVMDDLLSSLGAETPYDPFSTECCGSYHIVGEPEIVDDLSNDILASAVARGADAIVTSCPLCHFNLDETQKRFAEQGKPVPAIPVLYFTQLLALALGLGGDVCHFDIHHVDPRPMLQEKGLIS
jgi:heterodisulfide reductase subunit B